MGQESPGGQAEGIPPAGIGAILQMLTKELQDGCLARGKEGCVLKEETAKKQNDSPILKHDDELLTPEEAARRLKVTAEQVRSLIRRGELAAINVGTGPKRPLYRITPRRCRSSCRAGTDQVPLFAPIA